MNWYYTPKVEDSTPQPEASPSPVERLSSSTIHRGHTITKINHVIDALIAWNTSQPDGQTQLRISIPTIKSLASAIGANYQPAIQQVLKQRSSEIELLHSQLMLGTRHNASVSHKHHILRAIARDFLHLDNWHDLHYS